MSAELCVVFYGVRYEPGDDELELLESREHPVVRNARNAHLDVFWGNFGGVGEKYYVFVGNKLGIMGVENSMEAQLSADELSMRITETSRKLSDAGLSGPQKLYLQWMSR